MSDLAELKKRAEGGDPIAAPVVLYLIAELEICRRALEGVEWAASFENGTNGCPECANEPDEGHDHICEVGIALAYRERGRG